MGDVGDLYKEWEEFWRERKSKHRESSTDLLVRCGVTFQSKNSGKHLVVGDYDFWPSTGLFAHRKTRQRGRGVFNLLKKMDITPEFLNSTKAEQK